MTVVTLCLEVGAFGDAFAGELAAALGIRLLDLQPLDLSVAELYAFAAIRPCGLEQESAVMDELSTRVAETTLQAAAGGDVLIVGWSAAAILAPVSSVISICVRAPRPRGAWRTVRRFGHDVVGAAPNSVEIYESLFFRFMRGVSGPKWRAPNDFDLVMDAGRQSIHDCRREIVEHVARRAGAKKVARAELAHLGAILLNTEGGRRDWPSLQRCAVAIGGDDVALLGVDSQEAAIALVERHLHGHQRSSAPANPLCRKAFD